MKKLYIFILLCLMGAAAPAQTGKKSKSAAKTSQPQKKKQKKMQAIAAPAEIFSMQELKRQREQANEDIELTSQLLKETSASAKNSLNRLNLLSKQLLSRRKVITLIGQEISVIDTQIKSLQKELETLGKDLAKARDNYAKSMQSQQKEYYTAQHKMLLILSAESLSQSFRRMRYLKEYADWQKEKAERITQKQEEITKRREQLETSKKEKQSLIAKREEESKKLEAEEIQQQKEVSRLNSKKKDLQKQLEQQKKEADALNRQIEKLIAEDMKKSISDNSSATKTAKGSRSMTEAELNLSKDFASNKGKLPFPVKGKYTVVSKFGEHQHQKLSHVRTNNDGIDIQTTSGSEARAVFKGVVTGAFVMPGYNSNVIVRHGNYLTVYCNLSKVYVKIGDSVATRQPLGKIYTDSGNGNSTILHFQLWKEQKKLNPEPWLK